MRRRMFVAALAALALVPAGAQASAMDVGGPEPFIGVQLDPALDVPASDLSAPHPVVFAVAYADAMGIPIGSYDDEMVVLGHGPLQMPIAYYDGLLDQDGAHPGFFLRFTQSTDGAIGSTDSTIEEVLATVDWATDQSPLARAPHPERAAADRLPRMILDLDVAQLYVGAQVSLKPGVASASFSRDSSVIGSLGAVTQAVPGEALQVEAAFLAPASHEGLAGASPARSPSSQGPLGVQGSGIAPQAPVAGTDAVLLAAGLVATGLLLGGLALYHLVNRNNIFDNDVRMRVYDVVARNPGVTIQEVAREVGLSHPTARYHLNVLSKNDLVVFLDKGNKMMFFRNRSEFSEVEREVVAILRNPEALRVYRCIEENPWILRKELSERLGISRTSVNWHLRSLVRPGLVAESREQGKGFLFVRREGREVLVRVTERVHPSQPAGEEAVGNGSRAPTDHGQPA